jgi:hypothetical protein
MMYTDKILNTAYSFAAAIVVFGAWAKLDHRDFGSLALTIGMLVESGIFVIYGFVEWREQRQPAAPEQRQATGPVPAPEEKPAGPDRIDELQKTVEKTNGMLRNIFRAGEV